MTWNYANTPFIWPSLGTLLFLLLLAVYSGRRRSVPGATWFMIACLFGAAWAAGTALEYAASDLATKITWVKFAAIFKFPLVTAITCFILEYAWPGRWLTRRVLTLLSFTWLLEIGMILTDGVYHLAYRGFILNGAVYPQLSLGGWLINAYAIAVLGVINLIVFGWLFLRSPQQRWPVALMLIGQIMGRMIYLLERTHILGSSLHIDLLGMVFEFSMYALALFGFRIFDPIFVARQAVTAQMREGMFVLDPQGIIVSVNPAAQEIFDAPAHHLQGQPVRDLLPAFPEFQPGDAEAESELSLGSGTARRHYTLESTPLKDWRGLAVGRLLLLHDITNQKQVQTQLLEQQRALAILSERERLARELHDNLGQVLAFISTQGEVVQHLLDEDQATTVGSHLARLIQVADEAGADLRESILSLRTPFVQHGLISALQDYIQRYEQRYGLHTEILLPEDGLDSAFEPVAEVQILRILQEGLTNARRHSGTARIQIAFAPLEGQVQITMRDEGKGFDVGILQDDSRRGFGLRFMRERAEAIGGSLEVQSTPGAGTCLVVKVPINHASEIRGKR